MEKQTIINFNPIFSKDSVEKRLVINSFFSYILFFFELVIIIFFLYYFFSVEIIYVYHSIFSKEKFSITDKRVYNNYMTELKNIIESKRSCKNVNNRWLPQFDIDKNLLALDGNYISFDNETDCNKFIGNV